MKTKNKTQTAEDLINFYFPKSSKHRGKALVIYAQAKAEERQLYEAQVPAIIDVAIQEYKEKDVTNTDLKGIIKNLNKENNKLKLENFELKQMFNVRNDDAKDYAKALSVCQAKRDYWEKKYKDLKEKK